MTLPFDLRKELEKLRRLELAALKADNEVLRQRCKIFPPIEAELERLTEASSLNSMKTNIIIAAVQRHGGSKAKAADSLGIGRSTVYKCLRRINGVAA